MGKSKRIRSDRAQDIMTSPGKYSDIKADKQAKKTTVVLICVIAAIILLSVALIAFSKSGALMRGKVLYESENFEINGAMATYMYMNAYQQYYAYYGQYAQYFMPSDPTTLIGAKTMLTRAEAAKAAGYELTAEDLAEIDKSIDDIKASCKENKVSISEMYGEGVKVRDIRKVLELQKLASKIYTDKQDDFEAKIYADAERLAKYFNEHKSDFIKGDYLKVTVDSEYYEKFVEKIDAEDFDEEDFKALFIEYYVNKNLLTNYNSKAGDANKLGELDASIYKTVEAIVGYYVNDKEIEGITLNDVEKLTAVSVSADKFGEIYEIFKEETDEAGEDMFENLGKVAAEMCSKVDSQITVKTNYAYPEDDDDEDEDEDEGKETTAGEPEETTPEADGEDTGAEEEDKKTPTSSELSAAFDKWFFDEARKDNDIYAAEDEKTVYFVTKAAVKEAYTTKDVAHLLVKVDDVKDKTAMAEAKAKAEDLLKQFLAGEKTKDAFEKFAKEHTDDSGVIYENVPKGQMVEAFENWMYDEARKAGDTGVVETEYGYHVMFFIGEGKIAWEVAVAEELLSEDLTEWGKEIEKAHPITVKQKNIDKVFS